MIPEKAKLTLFKSVCTVWHFYKASDTRKLEKIKKRALRAVCNNKKDKYEELLSKAKLPILANRHL